LKNYGHLTSDHRAQIEVLRKQGDGPRAISRAIGFSPGTISRELRRNQKAGGGYDRQMAETQAKARGCVTRRPSKITPELREEIREGLEASRSPDQIAGRWAMEGRGDNERVSRETIYQIVAKDRKENGTLFQSLPKAGRKQRSDRCGTRRGHRLKLAPEQDIEKRPAVINERARVGDIEIDLIIGAEQKGVILVMTDRLSLHTQLASLPGKDADTAAAKIKELLRGQEVFSLTFDRGLEWARHAELAKELGVEVYFCKPYHSWEKGTVENTNGRIRRFLPKWESFPHEEMDHEWLREREKEMNNCPRKALGYYTPLEVKELWTKSTPVAAAA
jgi:transposase, IS30 family